MKINNHGFLTATEAGKEIVVDMIDCCSFVLILIIKLFNYLIQVHKNQSF